MIYNKLCETCFLENVKKMPYIYLTTLSLFGIKRMNYGPKWKWNKRIKNLKLRHSDYK